MKMEKFGNGNLKGVNKKGYAPCVAFQQYYYSEIMI